MIIQRCWLFILMLSAVTATHAVPPPYVIYVSSEGNDENTGLSAEKPFKTIDRALQEIRKPSQQKHELAMFAVRLQGRIELEKTLVLSPETLLVNPMLTDVTFQATNSATISGGQKIPCWQRHGKLWKTTIPDVAAGKWKFRELFVNGERRPRARTPNEGYFRINKAGPDNRTSFTAQAGDLPNILPVERAEVVFFHDWCTSHIRLKSLDFVSGLIETKNPIGNNAPHYVISHYEPHPRYYLENAPGFLDVPGEWYLDEKSGELTYYPLAKEFLDQTEFIAPRLNCLLELHGNDKQSLSRIFFRNIQFSHCAWNLPENGFAGMQAAFFENREPGQAKGRTVVSAAVDVDNAVDLAFTNCTFEHLGGSGLWLHENVQARIEGCTFRDIGANGLSIGEAKAQKVIPPVQNKPTSNRDPSIPEKWPAYRVRDCLFERCGSLYYGAVGIWIGLTNDATIENNELRNLPYTGISVGWMWNPTPTNCGNNLIEANHIHHIMQALSDGAGIYTLGRQPGTILRGNWIHDVPVNAGLAESNGIFMDEGSTDILVENNTIHQIAKSPIRFHKAGENTLKNNTLVVPPGMPPLKFNNTKPELIKVESANVIEHEGKWEPEKKVDAGQKK
jgi:hypothetical protein